MSLRHSKNTRICIITSNQTARNSSTVIKHQTIVKSISEEMATENPLSLIYLRDRGQDLTLIITRIRLKDRVKRKSLQRGFRPTWFIQLVTDSPNHHRNLP